MKPNANAEDMPPQTAAEPPAAPAATGARPQTVCQRLLFAFATGLGTGFSPKAPGTVGTLLGIPLCLLIAPLHPLAQAAAIAACIWLAVLAAGVAAARFGNSDDGRVVSDEIAGYLVAMAFLPAEPLYLFAAFVLFRLFDILKPWPCTYFDRQRHDAIGNVMDDVCAGIYARLLLQVWIIAWR